MLHIYAFRKNPEESVDELVQNPATLRQANRLSDQCI